ncbi:MAG: histidinol-phosphate transaminase [Bacteroidales bacterium]|nr:histidinol-phosphate transaminase [Bacteroidales bacterium]
MKDIRSLIRENIKELLPYSTARDDCKIKMEIYLDANENPYENTVNRYPSPFQEELKALVSSIRRVPAKNIFLGNGSDEAIDLVYRIFCEPGKSSVAVVAPSYGMYSVAAQINDVRVIESYLNEDFELDAEKLLGDTEEDTKVIFICSPNNPSGNLLDKEEIKKVITNFNGIVVIDEAYIDFANDNGFAQEIGKFQNLIVLQTLSKAWGMAGLRLGIAFSSELIVSTMNKVKYPYNISVLNQSKGVELLKDSIGTLENIRTLISERKRVTEELEKLQAVEKVFKSDANFLLVKFRDKDRIFNLLQENGIIVRDRSSLKHCKDCLRITIGVPSENERLIGTLKQDETLECGSSEQLVSGRMATVKRNTKETSIQVKIDLDTFTAPYIRTGLYFFDHMLEQIGYHGGVGLDIICSGDLKTGCHHTIEDTAIALGEALNRALGEKKGIERYGFALPMDESEATVLIDLGGRIDFKWEVEFKSQSVGDVASQMFEHFFKSLSENLKCNLHIRAKGDNDHHIIEGIFKAFARAIKCAVRRDEFAYGVASSKGVL